MLNNKGLSTVVIILIIVGVVVVAGGTIGGIAFYNNYQANIDKTFFQSGLSIMIPKQWANLYHSLPIQYLHVQPSKESVTPLQQFQFFYSYGYLYIVHSLYRRKDPHSTDTLILLYRLTDLFFLLIFFIWIIILVIW